MVFSRCVKRPFFDKETRLNDLSPDPWALKLIVFFKLQTIKILFHGITIDIASLINVDRNPYMYMIFFSINKTCIFVVVVVLFLFFVWAFLLLCFCCVLGFFLHLLCFI